MRMPLTGLLLLLPLAVVLRKLVFVAFITETRRLAEWREDRAVHGLIVNAQSNNSFHTTSTYRRVSNG